VPRGAEIDPDIVDTDLTDTDLTEDGPERPVTLTELFGHHDQLVLYHLMLHPEDTAACAACSMFVAGLDGIERHLTRHTAFAVMAPASLAALSGWARTRGWRRVRLVSSAGTTFLDDLGVAGSRGASRRSACTCATATWCDTSSPSPPTSPTAPAAGWT
jgi:predicted dithiol-disulfide oxidoreductase (DUF899 family)